MLLLKVIYYFTNFISLLLDIFLKFPYIMLLKHFISLRLFI